MTLIGLSGRPEVADVCEKRLLREKLARGHLSNDEDQSFDDIDAMMALLASGAQSPIKASRPRHSEIDRKNMARKTFEKRWLRDMETLKIPTTNRITPKPLATAEDCRQTLLANDRKAPCGQVSMVPESECRSGSDSTSSFDSDATEAWESVPSTSSSMAAFDGTSDGSSVEITCGDSDASSDDEEEISSFKCGSEPRQLIPEWAKGTELQEHIRLQFDCASETIIDPSTIFNPIAECDLAEIFKSNSKSRIRRKRRSTGKWSLDKLTTFEMDQYRDAMGYSPSPLSSRGTESGLKRAQ